MASGPISTVRSETAWKILLHVQDTIEFVDSKAAGAIAFAGALLALAGVVLPGFKFTTWAATQCVWLKLILLILAAWSVFAYGYYVWNTFLVIRGRSATRDRRGLIHFAEIALRDNSGSYHQDLIHANEDDIVKNLADDIFHMSGVAKTKLLALNRAVVWLKIVLVSWLITFIFVVGTKG